jgi:PAS domain S-box-containing protein
MHVTLGEGRMTTSARSSTALLRMAGRIARFGGWTLDLPDGQLFWSDEVREMLGYAIGETPGTPEAQLDLYEVGDRDRVAEALDRCIKDGTPFDQRGTLADAHGRWLHTRTIGEAVWADGEIVAVRGALLDETDSFVQARERQRLETRLAATMDEMKEAIIILDPNWVITVVNPMAERVLGRDSSSLLGTSGWTVFPNDGTPIPTALRAARSTRPSSVVRDFLPEFGHWFEVRSYPVDEGTAVYIRVVDHEELGHRALDEAKRVCRERAALLDVAGDAILVRGLDDAIMFWNRAAAEMYGWSAEEVVGQSVRELVYDDPAAFDLATGTTIRTGEWEGELEQRTRDGRTIIVSCRWSLHPGALGHPDAIYVVNRDVTETRKLEAEQRRNERLESLGSLAGGIAHDLNNVLTPILMAVELIQMPGADPAQQDHLLDSITSSVRRGAEMTTQVLAFASGVASAHGVVDIRQVLDEAVGYAHRTVPGHSRFAEHLASGLGFVIGDETQLLRVLLNLLSNARDAVAAGGDIELRADIVETAGWPPRLAVCVSDTGTGIDPEYLSTIFEPFVTTKPVGKGTGLGLSTARAIAVAHGGTLEVSSTLGLGTAFTLSLPWLSDLAPEGPGSQACRAAGLSGGTGGHRG